jgi:ABC-2 type transport system permease protein
LLSLLEVAVLLGSSAVFFGLGFRGGGLLLAAFAIILNVLVCAGLGLCEAAFVLLYKRGAPVNALVNMASQLLGGVLYPIAVLPVLLQVLAGLLPVTHTANALRLSLLTPDTSSALEELLALAILAPVYIAVGLVALSLALRLARSRGSLGQY